MESNLTNVAKEALGRNKVAGFLCVDQQGLCLAAEGVASEVNAPLIASISQLASKLDNGNKPVIQIGTDKWRILIQSKESVTTALYKSNN